MKRLFALLALASISPLGLQAQDPTPARPPEKAPEKASDKPAEKAVEKSARELAKDVTPEEAEKLIATKQGLIILDVRTEEEFDHEHIKGAVNLNAYSPEFAASLAALDQSKPVLVHCGSGGRSARALKEMKVKFPEIYHLNSGIAGWKEAKKPLETKPLPGAGRIGPKKK
jgi:rhodanese-related sulfurtransferase